MEIKIKKTQTLTAENINGFTVFGESYVMNVQMYLRKIQL